MPKHHLLTWVEGRFNRVTASRWSWFPFFSMRPAPQEFITISMIVTLTVLVFAPAALLGAIGIYFYAEWLGLWPPAAFTTSVAAFVFGLAGALNFQYLSAYFWNRRAERLQRPGQRPVPVSEESTLSETPDDDSPNPFLAPKDRSVAAAGDHSKFRPHWSLLFHEVFFCHGSLLLWFAFCLRGWFDPAQSPTMAETFRSIAVLSGLQAGLLLVLTAGLASRQSWLGRRTFFLTKVMLGLGQIGVVLHPYDQRVIRQLLMMPPVADFLLIWFGICGVVIIAGAVVQMMQPENPVEPLFGRNPGTVSKRSEQQSERW